jgi:hypothetical protein
MSTRKNKMKNLLKQIGAAMRCCLPGAVKPKQPQPPCIKDGSWRVVKSSDGIYGLEQYHDWFRGWRFSGVSFESEEAARHTKKRFEQEEERAKVLCAKTWKPLDDA